MIVKPTTATMIFGFHLYCGSARNVPSPREGKGLHPSDLRNQTGSAGRTRQNHRSFKRTDGYLPFRRSVDTGLFIEAGTTTSGH